MDQNCTIKVVGLNLQKKKNRGIKFTKLKKVGK